ncbi:phycoerythrobilin:ferredoxin oxidoreductase [Prochlorococcus marinus str. MU1402]|uniref:phycoerythrobilin:ferredoxin oxidoreductase n=1 Tax=Prochlorococcus marinus TaxID=1219 RepID=UPI001AD971BF|nr:phycoerythrobilin:ferredoxin oxidoreductase [Prochlorococcus marinus]MBO8232771.1 phycoerythrobilin:ferredoxin oxidoreductase [Prochlorococcus marinus XMU1402]MBW3057480.1 phycoerythrobilin:ferredoxin oxidoreductase [Prochlorococcus marinus str. MU1402]
MLIQDTIFYRPDWRWHNFLKYLTKNLIKYKCQEKIIPSEYSYKDSTYGSKKSKKNVNLSTWCVIHKKRIQLARAVCINSPNYSVLNFLIIPNSIYNIPFFGVDFVSLPNSHLLVLDFQPSLKIQNQYDNELLEKLKKLKTHCHSSLPCAEKMSADVARFFSPGVIWSKLPKEEKSDFLIANQLYTSFKEYFNLYLKILFASKEVNIDLQKELINGQNNYLKYRRDNDPARPMLSSLFGKEFTESLIKEVLFTT